MIAISPLASWLLFGAWIIVVVFVVAFFYGASSGRRHR